MSEQLSRTTDWIDPKTGRASCPECDGFGYLEDDHRQDEEVECETCLGNGVATVIDAPMHHEPTGRRRYYAHITDPTAVNWDGDLDTLPWQELADRQAALALYIAAGLAYHDRDPHVCADLERLPPLELYRETADEIARRMNGGL